MDLLYASMATGVLNSFLLTPIEMLKIQMQLTRNFQNEKNLKKIKEDPLFIRGKEEPVTVFSTVRNICKNSPNGSATLYRGIHATMIRDFFFCRKFDSRNLIFFLQPPSLVNTTSGRSTGRFQKTFPGQASISSPFCPGHSASSQHGCSATHSIL